MKVRQASSEGIDAVSPSKLPARLWLLVKVVVSAGSLYVVARSLSFDELGALLRGVEIRWLALALIIFWLAQFASALRYWYVARALERPVSYNLSVRLHFIGLWFNQVFPTSLGGDLVKILLVKSHIGLNYAFRTTVLERAAGLIFLFASVLALLPLYRRIFADTGIVLLLGLTAAGALGTIALLSYLGTRLTPFMPRIPLIDALIGVFESMWNFRKGALLWEQTWTSAIVHFNGIISFALAGKALGLEVPLLDFILVTPLVFLIALLPISFAGWGIRELGSVWLFGLVGVSTIQSTTMSILFGLMLIAAGLPGLVLSALTLSNRQSEYRKHNLS